MHGTKKLLNVIGGKSVILTIPNAPSISPELVAVIGWYLIVRNKKSKFV